MNTSRATIDINADSDLPDRHEDVLAQEIRELEGVLPVSELDILSSVWTSEQLAELGGWLEPYIGMKVIDAIDLYQLSVKLGRIGRKLDLTGSSATSSTLRHLYGTIALAHQKTSTGGKVHLLEAISAEGYQLAQDVDLVYTGTNGTYQVDYTNFVIEGQPITAMVIPDRRGFAEKYRKLEANRISNFTPRVMSMNIPHCYFEAKFTVPRYEQTPREDDFKAADEIIDQVRSCRWPDAELCLKDYADVVSGNYMDTEKLIETPTMGKWFPLDKLIKVAPYNSPEAAEIHQDVIDSLMRQKEKASGSERYWNFFCPEVHENYSKLETKRLAPLPPCLRGFHHRGPFDRLRTIVAMQVVEGLIPLAFWEAASKCGTEYQLISELSSGFSRDSTYLEGVRIKRATTKDGEAMKAIKVQFPKGKSLSGWRELLKANSEYDKAPVSHAKAERLLNRVWNQAMSPSQSSQTLDDVAAMVPDVMTDDEPSNMVRLLMTRVLKDYGTSHLMTQLSQLQEVSHAILSGIRKCRAVKGNKGTIHGENSKPSSILLSLETVTDCAMVVMNNLGPLDQSGITDVSYAVTGLFLPSHEMTYPTVDGSSRLLSMSHAQLDWNSELTHKAISWLSMIYEENAATHQHNTPIVLPKLPLFLMFLNSNKFSQVAEQVRYVFVNGISLSTGPKELIEKISWYTPRTCVEKLYLFRMIKLMHVLSAVKSTGDPKVLKVKTVTNVAAPGQRDHTITLPQWNVAMPDQDVSSNNEQAVFNSFYVCKTLTIQRYNKLTSEALVLDKQLDARRKYLEIKALNLKHEGRNMDMSGVNYRDTFQKNIEDVLQARPFSPSPLVGSLGVIATALKMRQPSDDTVGDTMNRVYKLDSVVWQMSLTDAMNSRGSVLSKGEHGVSVTAYVTKGKKKVKVTQNSKCYETILLALQDMRNGVLPATTMDWTKLEAATVECERQLDCGELAKMSDKMWTLVYYFSCNFSACVSKMVHKDQLGAREIAVLNAASRIMCRYTEMLARHIRDLEHQNGVVTNLIERSDKHDHIVRAVNSSNMSRRSGLKVMYDSADCSKWGPSIMMHTLYLSVGARVEEEVHRDVLRNCYALFGNKVFKIPDEFYLHGGQYKGEGDIRKIVNDKLLNMGSDMGSYENQILYLEESMHQGICGVASSVMGSDAQNLSNYVTDWNLSQYKLKTVSYITSDDYCRVLTWDQSKGGTFQVARAALAQHYMVLQHCGIQRNATKSGMSDSYMEFNSEFHCPTGEIRPDIKSRLSYVSISPDIDNYDCAVRAMSMSSEFLRNEGSLVGAAWTFLLNNHLSLLKNQGIPLWKRIRSAIYKVPLELGGLIRPNPLKSVVTSSQYPLLENYGLGRLSVEDAFSLFTNMQDNEPKMVEVDSEGKSQIKIPSFSRSNVISLCRYVPRATRKIRDMLMAMDPRNFLDATITRKYGSIMLALMACSTREAATGWNDGSAINFAMSQVKYSSLRFRVVSDNAVLSAGMYSRKDLHELAIDFLSKSLPTGLTLAPIDVVSWDTSWNTSMEVLKKMRVGTLSMTPRHVKKLRFRENYATLTFVQDKLALFDEEFLPKALGGISDLHPWHYLESKMLYSNRLSKLSHRRQDFRVALRDVDEDMAHLIQKLMVSNFSGGCRLNYVMSRRVSAAELPVVTLDTCLTLGSDFFTNPLRSMSVSILSPELPQYRERNIIGSIDITDFCNALLGSDDRVLLEHSKVQQLLMNFKEWSKGGRVKLVVAPGRLACQFPERRFKSSAGVEVTQKPLLSVNGPAGRHVYAYQKGLPYVHDFTHIRDICPVSEQGLEDVNRELDLTENDLTEVQVKGFRGFSVLVQKHTDHILQVFSQLDLEVRKVKIYTREPLHANVDLMERLNLSQYMQVSSSQQREVFDAALGFRLSVGEHETGYGDILEYDVAGEASVTSSQDQDSDVSSVSDKDSEVSDFEDLTQFNLDDPTMMVAALGEVEIGKEEVSDFDSDLDVDEGSKPASEGGFVRPSTIQYESLRTSALRDLPEQAVNLARRKLRTDVRFGYEFSLPFDPGAERFAQVGGSHPVDDLITRLDNMPEGEREWAKEFLLYCLVSYGPVRATLTALAKRAQFVDAEEEDIDW